MPRRVIAAAKPARSPTTPPPSATTTSPRSQPRFQDRLDDLLQLLEALRAFARRNDDLGAVDAGRAQRGAERRQVELRDVLVGDDRGVAAREERGDPRAGLREQPGADHDIVASRAELDAHAFGAQDAGLSLEIGVERRHDLADDRLVRALARGDRDVGLRVDRLALGQQLSHDRFRVGPVEERPVALLAHPLEQHRRRPP